VKSHAQELGVLVDVSVKFTVNGNVPDTTDALKSATGGIIVVIELTLPLIKTLVYDALPMIYSFLI
jgi:hypothetical protein